MKFLLALAFVGLLSLVGGVASAQSCTNTGGYPWTLGSCLSAGDLNKIVALNAGTLPPHNTSNQGALYGTLWLDTSTIPYALRLCHANPCFASYNATQWALWGSVDITTGLITFNQSSRPTTRRIDSGSTDIPTTLDNIILWYSSVATAKTETLPVCNTANQGQNLTVVDGANTAVNYNIVVQPIIGNTIGGRSSYPITVSGGSVGLSCNGISDWGIVTANGQAVSVPFSLITSRPTTLAGYGITDAIRTGTLGTMSTQNASSVAITGGSITGMPTPGNPTDAANKAYVDSVAASSVLSLLVDTTTGTANITTSVLEWIPTTPAPATRTLPATPALSEIHIVSDKLAVGNNYTLTVAANTGQQILVNGSTLTSYVLYMPSTATFRYIGSVLGTNTWAVE